MISFLTSTVPRNVFQNHIFYFTTPWNFTLLYNEFPSYSLTTTSLRGFLVSTPPRFFCFQEVEFVRLRRRLLVLIGHFSLSSSCAWVWSVCLWAQLIMCLHVLWATSGQEVDLSEPRSALPYILHLYAMVSSNLPDSIVILCSLAAVEQLVCWHCWSKHSCWPVLPWCPPWGNQ